MSDDQLLAAPARPADGMFARALRAGSARSASLPIGLAGLGAIAYALALALNWITVTLPVPAGSTDGTTPPSQVTDLATGSTLRINGSGRDSVVTIFASNNITNPDMLGMLFGLGGLALLSLAAAVVYRADVALRMRPAMLGLGVGMGAVVVAAALRLPGSMLAALGGSEFSYVPNFEEKVVAYQPGLFCALGAVVLPVLAIWLRSRPNAHAARLAAQPVAAAPVVVEAAASEADPVEPEFRRPPRTRVEPWPSNDRPAEPYDLTVTPEP